MMIKYDISVDEITITQFLDKITNQTFKLLPLREEKGDWESPLQNLLVEMKGAERLLVDQVTFFSLISKMEGLLTLTNEEDFLLFRKNIFECLSLLTKIKSCLD